jgi:dienelactone hydrolase
VIFIIALSLLEFTTSFTLYAQLYRKSEVSFKATDGLEVSADLYQSDKSNPYIILFHQEQSCKGEFDSIAPRFIKMNFNCMAVDLRSGNDVGFSKNLTAQRARENGYQCSLTDAIKDIEGSIIYLNQLSEQKVSLYGSASSGSLALFSGRTNDLVKAVVAFSPGDYFSPEIDFKKVVENYPKPLFIACTKDEYPYLSGISGLPGQDRFLFQPTHGNGLRGTQALTKFNPERDEYWLQLLLFFKSLK